MTLQDLNFLTIFRIILRHLLLVIVIGIIGGVIGFVQSYYYTTPTYSSSGVLMVLVTNEDYAEQSEQDTTLPPALVAAQKTINMSNLTLSARLAADCIVLFQIDQNFNQIASGAGVSVTQIDESRFLRITATSTKRDNAQKVCNDLLEHSYKLFKEHFSGGTMKIVRQASPPAYSSGANITNKVQTMGLIGILIGLALAFLIEFIDSTIKPGEDLAAKYNAPVLAEILNLNVGKKKS